MLRRISYLILAMSTITFLDVQAMPRDPSSGLKIMVEGLDLRGNGDFLQYAELSPVPSDVPTNFIEQRVKKVIPKYDLGYGLGIGYQFPCSGNDIELRWQHFDSRDTNTIVNPSTATVIEIPFILGSGLNFNLGTGRVKFKYNAVDFDLAHTINFFNCFQTRFYAGVRYVRLERKLSIQLENPVSADLPVRFINITTDPEIKGAGPQIGINSTYYFIPSFGLETDLSISGITESAKTSTVARVLIGPTNFEIINVIKPDDQNRLIAAIDGRLGLQYRYQFCNGTAIKVSAGYQFTDYLGAFNSIIIATNEGGGISSIDFRKIDATFEGPYLRLSVKI